MKILAHTMKNIPNKVASFLVLSKSMNSKNLFLEWEKYSDMNSSAKNMKANTNPISKIVRSGI